MAALQVSVDHAFDQLTGAHSKSFAAQAADGFKSWPAELRETGKLTAQALGLPCGEVEVVKPSSQAHLPTTLLNGKVRGIESRLNAWAAAAEPRSMAQALTADPVTYKGIADMIAEASSVFDALRKKPLSDLEGRDVSATIESCGAAVEKLIGLHPAESTERSDLTLRLLCMRVDDHITKAKLTINTRIAARDNDKTVEQCLDSTAGMLATNAGNPAMKQLYFRYLMEQVAD